MLLFPDPAVAPGSTLDLSPATTAQTPIHTTAMYPLVVLHLIILHTLMFRALRNLDEAYLSSLSRILAWPQR